MSDQSYDVIVVGTGFAGSFFLHRLLERSGRPLRVLVLEAGAMRTHEDRMTREGDPALAGVRQHHDTFHRFVNRNPEKEWVFETAFGGGSNCWYACTPRLVPEDFELHTRYGVGADWPITYDDLEPRYCDAEDLMHIAGAEGGPFPRSRPYPHEPHTLTDPDRLLIAAFPGQVVPHPCARTREAIPGQRGACCNNGVCRLCPVDAKFTVLNAMAPLYQREGVELRLGATVERVEHQNNIATGVVYRQDGQERSARADLVVLAANAMFNPHIMLRSGLDHPELGRGLCEQVSRSVYIELDGVENFQGSTISTALGYMFYTGERRRTRAAAMLQTINTPDLLNVRGRWRQRLQVNFVYEDFRMPNNRVVLHESDPAKPEAIFADGKSPQTRAGIASTAEDMQTLLAALPSRGYTMGEPWATDSHIMGTTVMGRDPATSVVDADCVHHQLRNLILLGSGNFPTAAPANPTLTIAALALYAADRAVGRA